MSHINELTDANGQRKYRKRDGVDVMRKQWTSYAFTMRICFFSLLIF